MTDEITPARMRELADIVDRCRMSAGWPELDEAAEQAATALRAAASTIEIERETNGATALLLQQARTALVVREELLRDVCPVLQYARLLAVKYAHTQGDNAEYHAEVVKPLDALAAEIAAALGKETDNG